MWRKRSITIDKLSPWFSAARRWGTTPKFPHLWHGFGPPVKIFSLDVFFWGGSCQGKNFFTAPIFTAAQKISCQRWQVDHLIWTWSTQWSTPKRTKPQGLASKNPSDPPDPPLKLTCTFVWAYVNVSRFDIWVFEVDHLATRRLHGGGVPRLEVDSVFLRGAATF